MKYVESMLVVFKNILFQLLFFTLKSFYLDTLVVFYSNLVLSRKIYDEPVKYCQKKVKKILQLGVSLVSLNLDQIKSFLIKTPTTVSYFLLIITPVVNTFFQCQLFRKSFFSTYFEYMLLQ